MFIFCFCQSLRAQQDFLTFRTGGNTDYMSIDQLINFLNEKQRDPRLNEILYPLYDDKRAKEIIDTYEQDDVSRSASRLTKDGLIR